MYCDTCMIVMENCPAWKKRCIKCFYKENPDYKKKVKESNGPKRVCVDCPRVIEGPSWKVRCISCYIKW